jgi:hypothetical protein
MSLHDYDVSITITKHDWPFNALIMAAIRQADNDNVWKLQQAFPETYNELVDRYNAPGGHLPGEQNSQAESGDQVDGARMRP